MRRTSSPFRLQDEVALISIHPEHVEKIMSGEKNVEFRRLWSTRSIQTLLIYATSPVQRLAGIVEVKEVVRASKTALWDICSQEGGGLSRRRLFEYFQDKRVGVGLRLGVRHAFAGGVSPIFMFGAKFRPPQSYRYLTLKERQTVCEYLGRPP